MIESRTFSKRGMEVAGTPRSLYPELRWFDRGGQRPPHIFRSVNKVSGPFQNALEYRQLHANLIMADFTLSLIEQVKMVRSTEQSDGRIFEVCLIEAPEFEYGDWHVTILDKKYRRIDWEKEKKLMYGSLLLLSMDHFRTFSFALVMNTLPDLLIRGIKGVNDGINVWSDLSKFQGVPFLMMETKTFYFPYFHVTEGLRKMEVVPFEEELVYIRKRSPTARYLKTIQKSEFNENAPSAQVSQVIRSLTRSQAIALGSVLSHRVALVQGPPGTGKTYLAVKIVECLLALTGAFDGSCQGNKAPLLVVTTTQHTVREFIQKCLKITGKVIHERSRPKERNRQNIECFGTLQASYLASRKSEALKVLRKADVIVMTTTRAAFKREEINTLGIKIVVVEEAAEALESFVVTSIPSTAQHLILLGDHKQLRPHTAVDELARKCHMDVSMFERLILNGFECPMLSEQRRMRPEIAELVRLIYPKLTDHPSTEGRPDVAGMAKNLFFLDHHHHEEQQAPGAQSYCNSFEAKMIVSFTKYLLHEGHDAKSITVLTAYKKQEQLISELMLGCRQVRVTCIDGFQGGENYIVLLSLVRANDSGKIGFLRLENRVCVAISRARCGLYVFGSMQTLEASGAPIWRKLKSQLVKQGALGPALPLMCRDGHRMSATIDAHSSYSSTATWECPLCQTEMNECRTRKKRSGCTCGIMKCTLL